MPRALVVAAVLLLLPTAPAAAQSYDSSFRFGLGLDYGGLFGRDDGGAGGLRLQLGARVHEYLAVYYQGQALGAGFVGEEDGTAMFLGWNAVLAELNVGIFQFGAGPSFDVTAGCGVTSPDQGAGAASGCFAGVAPGLATRAALRFGMFTLSVDLHASFHDDEIGTMVWGLMGIGMQLGDVPREPMRFAVSDRNGGAGETRAEEDLIEEPVETWSDVERGPAPNLSGAERARFVALGSRGLALDDPFDPNAAPMPEADTQVEFARPEAAPPETAPSEGVEPERAAAPVVRRFTPTDVTVNTNRAPDAQRAVDPSPRRRAAPRVRGGLEFEGSDDPLEGLDGV